MRWLAMASISLGGRVPLCAELLTRRVITRQVLYQESTLGAVEISTARTLEPAGGGVCSGCSGDYAGDWEDPGELGADSGGSDCPLGTGGQREPQENRPSTEGARRFEDSADSECDSRWASLPGET